MAHVLQGFLGWMSSQGIEHSDAITLVAAAAGCSGLALGVQVRAAAPCYIDAFICLLVVRHRTCCGGDQSMHACMLGLCHVLDPVPPDNLCLLRWPVESPSALPSVPPCCICRLLLTCTVPCSVALT